MTNSCQNVFVGSDLDALGMFWPCSSTCLLVTHTVILQKKKHKLSFRRSIDSANKLRIFSGALSFECVQIDNNIIH